MAAMIASRRASSSSRLLQKLFSPARPLTSAPPSTVRSLNTNALRDQGNEGDRAIDSDRSDWSVSRRRDRSSSIADVLDPFYPSRSLSQVFNLMDQMMENPFSALSRGMSGGPRRGFDVREDEDALYLRVDMPGLGKEDVRISVEQNTLIIRGEGGEKDFEDDEHGRRYSSRIDLPQELFKLDQITAEMKNGVLKVRVAKVKEEEKKDVFQVKIE